MERGMNSCSWFEVLDKETSSNTDFLCWMKSSCARPEVSIMAAHHQQDIPFTLDGGSGGAGTSCRSSVANEAASNIYLGQASSCYGGGGGGGGGGGDFPFTNSQWKELERQATIYKCMISSVPVPHHLLFPLDSPVSTYGGRYSRKGDLEPGRCKRTDGKKWRCSKEVAPMQKYCDRHLHRGRPRSRKPVELNKKTRLQQNKAPPSAAIEDPLPSETDLAIATPYFKETNRDLDPKQPWENLMESDYRSSFGQDFTVQQQPLNLLPYPDFPSDLPSGFIDAWSIENLNSRSVEHSIPSSEGDLSPSLNLSMAMAVGEVLDEQMRKIQTEAPVIWWEGGGPLGEALQQGTSTPVSPYNSLGTTVSSPSGVLHRSLLSHSDGSVCNSPTLAPEISNNHWNFFP